MQIIDQIHHNLWRYRSTRLRRFRRLRVYIRSVDKTSGTEYHIKKFSPLPVYRPSGQVPSNWHHLYTTQAPPTDQLWSNWSSQLNGHITFRTKFCLSDTGIGRSNLTPLYYPEIRVVEISKNHSKISFFIVKRLDHTPFYICSRCGVERTGIHVYFNTKYSSRLLYPITCKLISLWNLG